MKSAFDIGDTIEISCTGKIVSMSASLFDDGYKYEIIGDNGVHCYIPGESIVVKEGSNVINT